MKKILFILLLLLVFTCTSQTTASATTYEYDNLHRLVKVIYDNGTKIIYTYDASGNLTTKRVVS